jgi:hypothetical protein
LLRKAAKGFGILRCTISDHVNGHIPPGAKPGKKPLMPPDLEKKLLEETIKAEDQGFGVRNKAFLQRAGHVAKK